MYFLLIYTCGKGSAAGGRHFSDGYHQWHNAFVPQHLSLSGLTWVEGQKKTSLPPSIWTSLFICPAMCWTPVIPLTTSSAFITTEEEGDMTCQHLCVCRNVSVSVLCGSHLGHPQALKSGLQWHTSLHVTEANREGEGLHLSISHFHLWPLVLYIELKHKGTRRDAVCVCLCKEPDLLRVSVCPERNEGGCEELITTKFHRISQEKRQKKNIQTNMLESCMFFMVVPIVCLFVFTCVHMCVCKRECEREQKHWPCQHGDRMCHVC